MATLNLAILQQLVLPVIFHRGVEYLNEGRVYQLNCDGNRVSGSVLGQGDMYQTWLQLDAPYDSYCSCPFEGTCKHVVAVALAWLDREAPREREATRRGEITRQEAAAGYGQETTSLYDRVAELEGAELLSLVHELLDTVDGTHEAVQEFLLERLVRSYGHRPGAAAAEARMIRDQVRDWLSTVETDPGDSCSSSPAAVAGRIDSLVDGIRQTSSPDGLPFAVLSLTGVAIELAHAATRYDDGALYGLLQQSGRNLMERLSDPNCPPEVAFQAIGDVLAAYLSGTRMPALESVLRHAAAIYPGCRDRLIALLRESGSAPALELAAQI